MTTTTPELRRPAAGDDPLLLFQAWYAAATAAGEPNVDTMSLATATPDGAPSLRAVLYKGLSSGRIRFFTCYTGRKGRELAANPRAALLFCWHGVFRQVRVEGRVERLSDGEADAYFLERPRESRLSAIVSPQSEEVESVAELERRVAVLEAELHGREVTRPPGWGGFAVEPQAWEFWIGRHARLHERYVFRRDGDAWRFAVLAP